VCGLPKLIAACHVLHRLSLPRHPPCALSSLTIELTPRRQPNPFGPAQEITYISASEIGPCMLAHSVSESPKDTLQMIEHLPESVTCTNSHVLGLVFNAFGTCLLLMRLTALTGQFQLRYPINFVVKHQCSFFRRRSRALRLMKPVRAILSTRRTCLWVAVTYSNNMMNVVFLWRQTGNSKYPGMCFG
jgi:hypothetical protein